MTIFALIAIAVCPSAPPDTAEVKKRAAALVIQLGDSDYRDRESAARELLAIGYPARDAVLAGQQSKDQEISERCRKLYPAIWRHELEKRVHRFVNLPDQPIPDDLPGAARWLQVAGDSKVSRELYGEMVTAHPEQLLELELNPSRRMDLYRDHQRNVYARVYSRVPGATTPRPTPTDAEILLFLFLGSTGEARPAMAIPGISTTHSYQFLNAPSLAARLSGAEAGTPVRRLYSAWLDRERYSTILRRAIDIAAQNKVTECAPATLQIASDRTTSMYIRATALLGFGRLGTKSNLKDLESFLQDKTPVATVVVNGVRGSVQLRDVALGAAIHLVGENLSDFGFERKPPAGLVSVTSYTYYAFGTDEKRDAAHQKWKEWATKNLKE